MKKFFNKTKSSGNKKFAPRGPWQRSGDREERPAMHPATCSACDAPCEVPFKPNGRKPIFCRDCFRKEEDDTLRFDRPGAPPKPPYHNTPHGGSEEVIKQLKLLNTKMDRLLEALTSAENASTGDEE